MEYICTADQPAIYRHMLMSDKQNVKSEFTTDFETYIFSRSFQSLSSFYIALHAAMVEAYCDV